MNFLYYFVTNKLTQITPNLICIIIIFNFCESWKGKLNRLNRRVQARFHTTSCTQAIFQSRYPPTLTTLQTSGDAKQTIPGT